MIIGKSDKKLPDFNLPSDIASKTVESPEDVQRRIMACTQELDKILSDTNCFIQVMPQCGVDENGFLKAIPHIAIGYKED